MLDYVCQHFNSSTYLSILEPSAGDGSFVRAFAKTRFPECIRKFSLTAIDKVPSELEKAQNVALTNKKQATNYSFISDDFLKYQDNLKRKFHLIVGNPPYIKKQLLSKYQIDKCQQIFHENGLSQNKIKNIWTAFLVSSCQLLAENGVLAFVLPAELLQVKFSQELREYLRKNFSRTEIFTFDELLFDCKGQDTVILVAFKTHTHAGQFYTHITNTEQLLTKNFTLTENEALSLTGIKWTHHSLTSGELLFIHELGERLNNVGYYCDSKPGIVTAANNFFIVNSDTQTINGLEAYCIPIIQKGSFVNGSVVFKKRDYNELVIERKPTKLLSFDNSPMRNLPNSVRQYLISGRNEKLHLRHKCRKRKNWHVIPNISEIPQGFFFKRCHHYPKLLKNDAKVFVTDSAYKIKMKDKYNINGLVYSFYNSLTLAFAELKGRYYGGGVLELTPLEFKSLPIPYVDINAKEFNDFAKSFENKNNIEEILNLNDFNILNSVLGLSQNEIQRVNSIYRKLITKRFRIKEN